MCGFLRENRLKTLKFSFSSEKKNIYTQKIVVKLILAKKMTKNGYSHFSFSPEKKHIYTQKIVVKLILAKKMTENGYSH